MVVIATMMLGGCATAEPPAVVNTIHVPADASTIADAVAEATPGDLILVAPGEYRESVIVDVEDVTIRGEDRNETVIDGEGVRPYGVVGIADGVRVENLTSHSHLYYGVLITGVHTEDGPEARGASGYAPFDPDDFPPLQRFSVDHVTAYNNGLYGIYAFNAQHGSITDSYASGSADSGIYVGQCRECDTLVEGNIAERNAIGFENANASDSVVITGNRFSDNRVGMTLISNYQEAFTPQRANVVVGNVVSDNNSAESPAHAEGAFGVGVGVEGGQQNMLVANLIAGHSVAGVVFSGTEDLAAVDNRIEGSTLRENGVDVANTSADRAPATGNCAEPSTGLSTLPADLGLTCGTSATGPQPSGPIPTVEVPPGMSFLRVAAPPAQPSLDAVTSVPDPLPGSVPMPSVDDVAVPPADLLSNLTSTP
jgi:nitrous oxidase accessory protein NosD